MKYKQQGRILLKDLKPGDKFWFANKDVFQKNIITSIDTELSCSGLVFYNNAKKNEDYWCFNKGNSVIDYDKGWIISSDYNAFIEKCKERGWDKRELEIND